MHTKNNRFSWLFLVLVTIIMLSLAPAAQAAGRGAPLPPSGGKYTVRANDTLWDIATRYGMTVAQLTAANPGINPAALRPGQILTLPTKTSPVSNTVSEVPCAVYAVAPNDTLWDIAANYGLTLDDLLAANPGVDPKRLMVGQELIIPGLSQEALAAAGRDSAPAEVAAPVEAAPAEAAPAEVAAVETTAVEATTPAEAAEPAATPAPEGVAAEAAAASDASVATEAAAAAPAAEAPPAVTEAPAPEAINPMAQEMLDRINEKRVAGGLPALAWNTQLAAAAQAHAADCANRNRGSHVGSDGARLTARLQRTGFAASWSGENWANARSVERAMQMWWNEPPGADPHVQNIMARRATEVGIGVASGAWGIYFIADFGSQ